MVEAAILICRWLGLRPTHPSQRYEFCLRSFFMVNLPHGREVQGSLGVRSLLLRSILRLVRLNGLSVVVGLEHCAVLLIPIGLQAQDDLLEGQHGDVKCAPKLA